MRTLIWVSISILAAGMFRARSAQALDGHVLDAINGQPVRGAIVTATVAGGTQIAVAAEDGSFQFASAPQKVAARAIGYGRAAAVTQDDLSHLVLRLSPLRPKGLYLSVYGVGDAGLRDAAVKLVDITELNALVIDVKGDRGLIPYPSGVAGAISCGARSQTTVRDMSAVIAYLKSHGIYLIGRIVVFKDHPLANCHPEWAVKVTKGQLFRDREQQAWIDPSRREAWSYSLALAAEAAALGFDEIQFDYVRFPDAQGLQFSVPGTAANRSAAITGFLAAARARLAPYNVFIGADIFGYVAWNESDTGIGQDLLQLVETVDYLSPLLYPSGYKYGIPGYADPIRHPYEIVYLTLRHALERAHISPLRLRPWLQAFRDYAFDRRLFDADEIRAQIRGAEQAGSDGWMLWNPRNIYTADGLSPR
ncbi:putative glycoside hydrolase [Duganella radicis]|uniref:GTP-binding protein n=1 Tax=Duganella radicis TaxID=551988 RepID=A0A6L6PCH8_9BURK|nr:putative glycoside hydrolase [Duganella radicis]MTV36349.1 GTP-binding protein [Duganella radicis]